MTRSSRVIGAEHVSMAQRAGKQALEIMAGDIVTGLARETAERLGIRLLDGPLERPAIAKTDGSSQMMRGLYRRSPHWIGPKKPRPLGAARRLAKLGLIGAGGVGANIAHLAANGDMADEIALVDIVPGLAQSVAMDLNHASGISGSKTRASGGMALSGIAGSEVVIVTAGRARSPGMSRSDLIDINARVIRSAAEAIISHAPDAIVIVVTNPLDEMTFEMLRSTGLPREKVLGMAGTLDSSRFRNALARAAKVNPSDVEAITLGSHGDEMAPIVSKAKIKGRPVSDYLSQAEIDACVRDAVTGGGQVVALRKTGSATLAPAHASIELVDHIRGAKAGAVPVSVMLEGEYGISGVVLGVPCHLGARGVVAIEEMTLPPGEMAALKAAADAIRKRLGG
ncbi:MAG: malate dehydrogenase [Hoeflea sp.]|nr:malate dehydrogenase [Hoeflea sp.]